MVVHIRRHLLHSFSYRDITAIDFTAISSETWVKIGYVVLGATFVSYICTMIGQRLLRPTIVSMYNYIQPIVTAIIAMAWEWILSAGKRDSRCAGIFRRIFCNAKASRKRNWRKES